MRAHACRFADSGCGIPGDGFPAHARARLRLKTPQSPGLAGLGSVALVLSVLVPSVGNTWYGLTALSPLAALYYFQASAAVLCTAY